MHIKDFDASSPKAELDYIVALEEHWHESHVLLIDYNNQVPRFILDQKYVMLHRP